MCIRDSSGAKLPLCMVSQIQVSEILEGYTVCLFLAPDDERCPSETVPGGIDALWSQDQEA